MGTVNFIHSLRSPWSKWNDKRWETLSHLFNFFIFVLPPGPSCGLYPVSHVFCLVINELGAFLQMTTSLNHCISLTHTSHQRITTGIWGETREVNYSRNGGVADAESHWTPLFPFPTTPSTLPQLLSTPLAVLLCTTEGTNRATRSQRFYGHAQGAKRQTQTHMDVDLQPVCPLSLQPPQAV